MISIHLLILGIITFLLACIIFLIGRSIHEYSHYFVAKCYKIKNIKVDFNLFREPLKGAKVDIPDKQYFQLTKQKRFSLLISGVIIQYPFYLIIWFIVNSFTKSFEFIFLFSLVMIVLIIPDIIINTIKKEGDIYRLLRLKQ